MSRFLSSPTSRSRTTSLKISTKETFSTEPTLSGASICESTSLMQKLTMPCSSPAPSIVKVLPEFRAPYANTVAFTPSNSPWMKGLPVWP